MKADGRTLPYVLHLNDLIATYSVDPGYEIEFLSPPKELDAFLGYEKSVPFLAEPWG